MVHVAGVDKSQPFISIEARTTKNNRRTVRSGAPLPPQITQAVTARHRSPSWHVSITFGKFPSTARTDRNGTRACRGENATPGRVSASFQKRLNLISKGGPGSGHLNRLEFKILFRRHTLPRINPLGYRRSRSSVNAYFRS